MLKELQDLGLSEKEARVYLAALEIGQATADQLAKHAKIKRPTTYVQLESLMKMGLMSTYEEGKKTMFAPESPELLKKIFDAKKREFESRENDLATILPELTKKFEGAGERPIVRFFDGKEGVARMRDSLLALPSGTELKFIYCHDALANVYSEKERYDHAQKRSAKGIYLKAIYTRKDGPFSGDDIVEFTERRFIPYDRMPIHSDIYIYNNTVAIMALQGKVFGVAIESKEITQSVSTLFSLLWEMGQFEQKR